MGDYLDFVKFPTLSTSSNSIIRLSVGRFHGGFLLLFILIFSFLIALLTSDDSLIVWGDNTHAELGFEEINIFQFEINN